jgi:enoyl-CoA hydratase/carnithine racemase
VTLLINDENRVRTLTLNRPDALNAFNEALYDATAEALSAAADDPEVAVVVITGTGRAFSAGQDLNEMAARISDPGFTPGTHGFPGLIDALAQFPKPLICAVNGLGLGLYISQEIAKGHGGTLTAQSTDGETRFTFSMPLAVH